MKEKEEYPFNDELREVEELTSLEDDYAELPPNDIIAYNELRSCADLIRMHKNGQLVIQPDFQRDMVWKKPDQTRFIDSLIKQLPIPSMCVSLDFNTNERLVIDGLQRMSTIISFLTNPEFQLSNLEDVDPKISGKSVSTIKSKNTTLYDRVENLTIPVTVIRCDYSKKAHMDYLFTIFHRLNSGGTRLNNQEIRNCIYNGELNNLIKRMVKIPAFKKLFNISDLVTYRFAFEELILRVFAFSENLEKYNGRLAKFLNDYMHSKLKDSKKPGISKEELENLEVKFIKSIDIIYNNLFEKKSIEKLSKSVLEGVLIGVFKNCDYLESKTNAVLKSYYEKLRNDENFSVDSLKEGLSQKTKVITRLGKAVQIFSGN